MGVRRVPWGGTPADAPLEAELQQKGLFQDIHHMAGQADLVVLTCSLTEITRGMVDSAFLKACKPGVRIINVARGVCCCGEMVLSHACCVSGGASQQPHAIAAGTLDWLKC